MSSAPPIAAHWIDGRPVEGDHAFDVAEAGGGAQLARYPRAAAQELARALAAAERGAAAWRARPQRERSARLRAAAERLGAADDERAALWRALALRLGLDAGEIDVLRDEAAAQAALAATPADGDDAGGVVVVAAHWSELVQGAARHAFTALARGAPLVLVSDPRAPMTAELVARALSDAGLDAGAWALLHDDVDRVVRELAADPRCARLVVSAPAAELARRFPASRAAGPARSAASAATAPTVRAAAPFGAGLGCRSEGSGEPVRARFAAVPLAAGTLVVADDEDLERAAARVVRAALSRLPALSGQRPGQAGRVLVPQRRFARFSAALLEHLETDSDVARPVPAIDRDEVRERRRARALGLDEGATLIWSGAPRVADRAAGEPAADGPPAACDGGRVREGTGPASHAKDGRASLLASVFTNVEPGGRLCDLSRPLPLVRLVRVVDELAGHRLAREIAQRDARPAPRAGFDPLPKTSAPDRRHGPPTHEATR